MLIGSDGFLGSRLQGGKFHPGFNGEYFLENHLSKGEKGKIGEEETATDLKRSFH